MSGLYPQDRCCGRCRTPFGVCALGRACGCHKPRKTPTVEEQRIAARAVEAERRLERLREWNE